MIMNMMNKKGDFEWSIIARWILVLVITVTIVILIYKFRGQILDMIEGIGDIFSFGGA